MSLARIDDPNPGLSVATAGEKKKMLLLGFYRWISLDLLFNIFIWILRHIFPSIANKSLGYTLYFAIKEARK